MFDRCVSQNYFKSFAIGSPYCFSDESGGTLTSGMINVTRSFLTQENFMKEGGI